MFSAQMLKPKAKKKKKSKIIDLSKEMYTCVQLFIREDRMATILYMIMIFFRPLPWYKVDFAGKKNRERNRTKMVRFDLHVPKWPIFIVDRQAG